MSASAVHSTEPIAVHRRTFPPGWRLIALALVAIGLIAVYMTWGANGRWDFVLPFRGKKVAAMVIVGCAIGASTVVFQTITGNRILTPSIMGFDALYMLIQTIAVFVLGGTRLLQSDPQARFLVDVIAMSAFSGALYWWLFVRSDRSVHLLVLAGIIFGVLFRSVTSTLQRMIDPTDFAVLQDVGFASFKSVDTSLLALSAGIVAAIGVVLGFKHHTLDAMLLGRPLSICIGVEYRREVMTMLTVVTVLVAVSTALVGPITFFGLLVAHLAYELLGTSFHRYTIPGAGLAAVIFLVGGQFVLERVFSFNSSLSIMIEFLGGVLFILLLLRGSRG